MASTNDLKNGMVLDLDGQLWQVLWFQYHKPGKGNTVVRSKLKNVLSGKINKFSLDALVNLSDAARLGVDISFNAPEPAPLVLV